MDELEEWVIELAVQRDRAEEGSEKYNEALYALERLMEMYPTRVPHMLDEYNLNCGYE